MFYLLMIVFLVPPIFVAVNFFSKIFSGQLLTSITIWRVIQVWVAVILPFVYLWEMDLSATHECCSGGTIFSPMHRIGVYFLIVASNFAFLVSIFRKTILSPIGELFINFGLVLGLVVLGFIFFQLGGGVLDSYIGVLPVILLYLLALENNHRQIMEEVIQNGYTSKGLSGRLASSILTANMFVKYPILVILLAPLLILVSLAMMLFGQKPDSLISAFTETYHHGFSQLDYLCTNVSCGGHFLCSVGANGHPGIVKPIRYGVRHGGRIICNRQLLVSNAFEELIQEKFPRFHRFIRKQYNKIGKMVHRHYHLFNKKGVSDITYIFMKPLEWFFLLTLYAFDKKPENRIAVQYIEWEERAKIKEVMNHAEIRR